MITETCTMRFQDIYISVDNKLKNSTLINSNYSQHVVNVCNSWSSLCMLDIKCMSSYNVIFVYCDCFFTTYLIYLVHASFAFIEIISLLMLWVNDKAKRRHVTQKLIKTV